MDFTDNSLGLYKMAKIFCERKLWEKADAAVVWCRYAQDADGTPREYAFRTLGMITPVHFLNGLTEILEIIIPRMAEKIESSSSFYRGSVEDAPFYRLYTGYDFVGACKGIISWSTVKYENTFYSTMGWKGVITKEDLEIAAKQTAKYLEFVKSLDS